MKCKYKYEFPVDEFGRPGAMYSLADLPVVGYKVLERIGTLKKRDTEKELYELEKILDLDDETINNFYQNNVIDQKLRESKILNMLKKFKI